MPRARISGDRKKRHGLFESRCGSRASTNDHFFEFEDAVFARGFSSSPAAAVVSKSFISMSNIFWGESTKNLRVLVNEFNTSKLCSKCHQEFY